MRVNTLPDRTPTRLFHLAERFWPALKNMPLERRIVGVGDVVTCLYTLPLAAAGIVWLAAQTEFGPIQTDPILFLAHAALILLFNRLNYYLIVELRENRYGTADGALDSAVLWSAVFLFGPVALWVAVLIAILEYVLNQQKVLSPSGRWNNLRSFLLTLGSNSLPFLVGFAAFRNWGGRVPLAGLTLETFWPAFGAILVTFVATTLLWSGYILYGIWTQMVLTDYRRVLPILQFLLLALALPFFAHPFGILLAGLYVGQGLLVFVLLMIGLFIVAVLTRQLSWTAESSRQQTRILEKLEQLSRAIITAVPDENSLGELLEQHLPNMFPSGQIIVWLAPDRLLVQHPEKSGWAPPLEAMYQELVQSRETQAYTAEASLPWQEKQGPHYPVILSPIFEEEAGNPFGGIYLELRPLAQPWTQSSLRNLFPAVQSLAGQVASAIHQSRFYRHSLDYERVTQELALAGQIQASFLPFQIPRLPGWQVSVTLDPVEETSGDFFDIIPLGDHKLGIVIADVADKGIGPALYMALSRTLIRTYAIEFDAQPDIVFFAANERILKDTRANLFVTAFYGILDLQDGSLNYCNAGHNPPFLLRSQAGQPVQALTRTGIPIGIEEGVTWSQDTIQIDPGDALVLYTDGIPDAQNESGQFFGDESLLEVARKNMGQSAEVIQRQILSAVYSFVGDARQFDDITLIVLIRDK